MVDNRVSEVLDIYARHLSYVLALGRKGAFLIAVIAPLLSRTLSN